MRFSARLAASFALCVLAAPALAQSPATAPSEYEDARGAPFGAYESVAFEILQTPLDAVGGGLAMRIEARLGEDWAAWRSGAEGDYILVDMAARRRLTFPFGTDAVESTSLYAEARRRLDIYAGLSRGGQAEMIRFGDAGEFDRTWLEAAMGLAANADVLDITETETGFEASLKGEKVFSADYGPVDEVEGAEGESGASACDTAPLTGDAAASARTLVRHVAPLHPDIMARLAQEERFPCAFDFLVYSPESPNGRREAWVLEEFESGGPVLPGDLDAVPPQAALIGAAGEAAMAAVRAGSEDAAPDSVSFFEVAADLRRQGDFAGAFLTTTQENHHFGPCPAEAVGSGRLACQEVRALTAAGIGDADFERVLEGTAAVREGDHATAVGRLSAFIDRDDAAGAAARILVANELVAWGREGLESRPDLDPAALLSEAIVLDPYAPDAYWHLARRYLEAGAPHAAWVFFDLGRALPGRDPTPLLTQADALEQRLAALAPDWTGQADIGLESDQQ
ncbi:hypothetical protein ACWCOP_11745 [Maricaulaceae bacterium MS644]